MKYRSLIAACTLLPISAVHGLTVTPKILGGEQAVPEWHSVVAIISTDLMNQAITAESDTPVADGQYCGGTLIANDWVLTAAHCVYDDETPLVAADINVLTGTHDLSAATPESDLLLDVKKIIAHPQYNPADLTNDIALVQLNTAANTSLNSVGTAVLALQATTDSLDSQENKDDILGALGWGAWDYNAEDQPILAFDLQEVALDYLTNAQCQELYLDLGLLVDTQMCANEPSPDAEDEFGEDTCVGDSGGPLFVNASAVSDSQQLGVTSFGLECGNPDQPGVYTRVTPYLSWIETTTTINSASLHDFTIAEDNQHYQGYGEVDFEVRIENISRVTAGTDFSFLVEHDENLTLTSKAASLSCESVDEGTRCAYTGPSIAAHSIKAFSFTANDALLRDGVQLPLPVTVTLDQARDYHRLNDLGTVTLNLGQAELALSVAASCLSLDGDSAQMQLEATLANQSSLIHAIGTVVSATLPAGVSLASDSSSVACSKDGNIHACALQTIEADSEQTVTLAVNADASVQDSVELEISSDSSLAIGSVLSQQVPLDFSRDDLPSCPRSSDREDVKKQFASSGGGGGSVPLTLLLSLAALGMVRRARG